KWRIYWATATSASATSKAICASAFSISVDALDASDWALFSASRAAAASRSSTACASSARTCTDESSLMVTCTRRPPGSGKLTTLKVLCSEMKINVIEWLPQINSRTFEPENVGFYQSMASQFDEFLSRATRYSNILNAMSSRLIVVKDVPNCFVRDPSSFHELLANYSQVPDVHLALILTDVPLARSLFPEHIKTSLPLTTASFNPVTLKGVKDALKKQFPSKCAPYIDGVAASCNGDLRQAIASFEFLAKNGVVSTAKKKIGESKGNSGKEDFIDIFHGLGRVLYSKREADGKLVHDPVEIGESFTSSPELFTGMLHENYLNTFSCVHDVAAASETLSMADTLLNDFKDSLASRSLSLVIASSGFMLRNSAPIKKFQQMNKPRKIDNLLVEFRSQFSDTNVLLDTVALGRLIPSFARENSYLLSQLGKLK
ncbi:unnamed protein product, partial [Nesidiocoris tenuis]